MRRILKEDLKTFSYKMQKLFCDGQITLTLFMEAYDCFSIYSYRNNVIYII